MQRFEVQASSIHGSIVVPPSKSHSMRAILLASLARGQSRIDSYLNSPDILAMIGACQAFGAKIIVEPSHLVIDGVDGQPQVIQDVIYAGNSGQVLRFVGAIAGLIDGYTVITGDHSLRYQRPLEPLIAGLKQQGCFAISTKEDGHAPIIIRGVMQGGDIILDGSDSQPVSALLMAACFAVKDTRIQVQHSGELPWVALTLSWLDKLGLNYRAKLGEEYYIPGRQSVDAFNYEVMGDFSSAAFLLVAAAIGQTKLSLKQLDMSDAQGDKGIIEFLQQRGFKFEFGQNEIFFLGENQGFPGFHLNINTMIDALPILAVLACFASSPSCLEGALIARAKESDRIAVMTRELRKMGALIEESSDGMKIWPAKLQGSETLNSHQDHRIAMALSIAAMFAHGPSVIHDVACVEKSFPNFAKTLANLGACIDVK